MKKVDLQSMDRFPDGTSYVSWERETLYSKIYYVDCNAKNASDEGPGTEDQPFKTINKAASVLKEGEKVLIAGGVYRECIRPKNGGSGPDKMISYEAAEGAEVVVKGSVELKSGWKPSISWKLTRKYDPVVSRGDAKVWEIELDGSLFGGYNPFGLINMRQDRYWFLYKTGTSMEPFVHRRGLVFVDGKPLEQISLYHHLSEKDGRYWVEHNGLTLHVRLPGDDSPENHIIEITTKEQVFAPAQKYLAYIRVKGITFEHAGNGFPVPQRGLVSTYRGNHWIIEDNTINWANSVGIDVGNECWNASDTPDGSYHIIRRNIIRNSGVCGIAGFVAKDLLVEDNLIEHCCWHEAEQMWESAAIKFHHAVNVMVRRNVIRYIYHGAGLWLDCNNDNCRTTGNIFTDISSRIGAFHIESTYEQIQIDNNIISNIKTQPGLDGITPRGGNGIQAEGSDKVIAIQNLFMNCECAGFHSNIIPMRITGTRGNIVRNHKLFNNIFYNCKRSAIELANVYNFVDGNIYSGMPLGFLRVGTPVPDGFDPVPVQVELLDLPTWREIHGWDENGAVAEMDIAFDPEKLTLSIKTKGDISEVPSFNNVETGYFGEKVGSKRHPGPFNLLMKLDEISVDPRWGKSL